MTIEDKATHYQIYLLTIWTEPGRDLEAPAVWRFGLKNPRTGQQRGFANLTALVTALLEEIANKEK